MPREKFHTWEAQHVCDTVDDLVAAYKNGFAGALKNKESEEALRHECRAQFGGDTLDEIAHFNRWAESGAGQLGLPYLQAEKRWPGCLPGTRQFVGSCVSHSQTKANLITLACELASGLPDPVTGQIEGPPEVPTSAFTTGVLHPSPIYWTRGYDGHGWSCPTAARNTVNRVGAVVCKPYDFGIDLSEITRSIECLYGSRQPPEDWREEFSSHLVRGVAEVRSFEAVRDALWNGYGISTCGSEGYSSQRDENGVSRRSGRWAHAMAVIAFDDRASTKELYGEPLVLVQNSWGTSWNGGPRRIRGTNHDIPEGSFWCRWSEFKARYMVAVTNFNGWPAQVIDHYGEMDVFN